MKEIWIDTDIGGDIDDALALLLAMSSTQIKIVGVSTVFENTVARAKIAKTLLSLGGFENVPVYAGEGAPLKATDVHDIPVDVARLPKTYEECVFGKAEVRGDAVAALHSAINECGALDIVTMGALTNIAKLLEDYPEDVCKINNVYIMGGAVELNLNEFNFTCDPEAAEIVLESSLKKKLITLDVTFRCALTPEQIGKLSGCRSDVVRTVLRMSKLWGNGMILHDPLTLGCLLADDFVEFEKSNLIVELEGRFSRGKCVNLCDFNWRRNGKDDLLVSRSVKAAEFCEYYVKQIESLDKRRPERKEIAL